MRRLSSLCGSRRQWPVHSAGWPETSPKRALSAAAHHGGCRPCQHLPTLESAGPIRLAKWPRVHSAQMSGQLESHEHGHGIWKRSRFARVLGKKRIDSGWMEPAGSGAQSGSALCAPRTTGPPRCAACHDSAGGRALCLPLTTQSEKQWLRVGSLGSHWRGAIRPGAGHSPAPLPSPGGALAWGSCPVGALPLLTGHAVLGLFWCSFGGVLVPGPHPQPPVLQAGSRGAGAAPRKLNCRQCVCRGTCFCVCSWVLRK